MPLDCRGVPVSARSEAALQASDLFNQRLLRMDRGVAELLDAQKAEPEDPLLNLYAAIIALYGQTDESNRQARKHIMHAMTHRADLSPRDHQLLEALTAFQAKHYFLSMQIFEEITEDFPQDLLSAKVCEFVYFMLGQQYCGPRFQVHMMRLAEQRDKADPDLLGMLAFATELSGNYQHAETLAHDALELEPRNPWAQHALSHALIREGRIERGIERMEGFMPLLKTCDPLILCHNAWHLALLYLEQLDEANAQRIFNERIWMNLPDTVGEQIDAIALAWRMEMVDFSMGDFWQQVCEHALPHATQVLTPFLSAHFAYALARGGQDEALAALLANVSHRAEIDDEEGRHIWAPVGRNLVEASAASAQEQHSKCAKLLQPAIESVMCAGGSDAQVDLFRATYAHSLVQSGKQAEATSFRRHWIPLKLPTPLDAKLFQN